MVKLTFRVSLGKELRSSFVFRWKVQGSEVRTPFRSADRVLPVLVFPAIRPDAGASSCGGSATSGPCCRASGRNRGGPAHLRSADPGDLAQPAADPGGSAHDGEGGIASRRSAHS